MVICLHGRHELRLEDVAMCTNPFDLFLDYGIQIKGRSKAVLTFTSQLTCDCEGEQLAVALRMQSQRLRQQAEIP
jgi:hypothetical protein